MKNELIKVELPEFKELDKSKAQQIRETFLPMAEMLETFEKRFNEIINEAKNGITPELSLKAKRLRLDISPVRIDTGKLKDKQKEKIKIEDKAIMAVHNILVWAVSEKEDTLKKIEKDAEIQEKKRLELLQVERNNLIAPYLDDTDTRDLSGMDQEVWEAWFERRKKDHFDKLDAIKKAEETRIENERLDAVERSRERTIAPYLDFVGETKSNLRDMPEKDFITLMDSLQDAKAQYDKNQKEIKEENEHLKKEREASEAKAKAEQDARDKQAKADSDAREKAESQAKAAHDAELNKEREAAAKIAKIEQEKREKLESELKAAQEKEAKAIANAEAKKQAELSKGDAEKVKDLILELESLKTKYKFDSAKNKKMYEDTGKLIDKVIIHIKK